MDPKYYMTRISSGYLVGRKAIHVTPVKLKALIVLRMSTSSRPSPDPPLRLLIRLARSLRALLLHHDAD